MKLVCAGLTDIGSARDHNEDDFYFSDSDNVLCIVADGMGGHKSGEVASAMAIKSMVEYYRETMFEADAEEIREELIQAEIIDESQDVDTYRLTQAMLTANKAVFTAASSDEEYTGMGTTLVSGFFTKRGVYIGNIGDSRAYRLRDNSLQQCTEDHSLANEYVRMGIIAAEEVEFFPYKNIIIRACGLAEEVDVDVFFQEYQVGDIYLFCSDGLSDMLADKDIEKYLVEYQDKGLDETCKKLVEEANLKGGFDNITLILAKVTD